MTQEWIQSVDFSQAAAQPGLQRVADTIRDAWEEAHGTLPGQPSMLTGSQAVALIIEDALSPAERVIGGKGNGHGDLLVRYVRTLFQEICVTHTADIEKVVGARVLETAVFVQPDTGWLVGIFRLGQPERPPHASLG